MIELKALTMPRVWPIPVTLFRHHIIITLAIKFAQRSRLSGGQSLRPECFTPAEQGPYNTGGLVGHRHQHNIGRPARKQGFEPWRTRFLFAPGPQKNSSRTMNQQLSQIPVSALRYAAEPFLAATGVLSWNQSKPGRQLRSLTT